MVIDIIAFFAILGLAGSATNWFEILVYGFLLMYAFINFVENYLRRNGSEL